MMNKKNKSTVSTVFVAILAQALLGFFSNSLLWPMALGILAHVMSCVSSRASSGGLLFRQSLFQCTAFRHLSVCGSAVFVRTKPVMLCHAGKVCLRRSGTCNWTVCRLGFFFSDGLSGSWGRPRSSVEMTCITSMCD